MTHIEQLLEELCPLGVECKPLGEVAKRNKGMNVTAAHMKKIENTYGNVRIFAAGNTKVDALETDIPAQSIIRVPSIIVKSRGNVSFEYYDKPFTHKNEMWSYSNFNGVDIKFVYYYLQNLTPLFQQIARANSVKLPQLCVADTDKFLIPVPPIEIQKKIVECLDKFSALAAELQAELQKRRTQYEYYRTRLLTPHSDGNSADNTDDCNWEWKTLGEVATLSRGKVYSKEYLRDNAGEYPVYSSQTANNGELGRINTYDYDGKYLTWTTDGAYAGTVFRREGKFSITNVCGLISNIDESLSIDFLFYWLNKVAKSYVYQGMGNPKLMSNIMSIIKIPIPPLAEQERIVSILDKFEALTTSLSDGIPAEQAAQQKRYEYYRDLLLTFPRKAV